MTADESVKALAGLRGRIEAKDSEARRLRAQRDALIARAVKNGYLTERDAAEAAGVSASYAHRAAVGRTGATATLVRRGRKR